MAELIRDEFIYRFVGTITNVPRRKAVSMNQILRRQLGLADWIRSQFVIRSHGTMGTSEAKQQRKVAETERREGNRKLADWIRNEFVIRSTTTVLIPRSEHKQWLLQTDLGSSNF